MHFQLKITLRDVAPPIWRRVLVPSDLTLFELHHVIQIAMGWQDYHLHNFTIDRQRYALPDPDDFDDPIDESKIRLRSALRSRQKFTYGYDFGDGWDHNILVEKVITDPAVQGVICIDGERACPPEDSGGPLGYEEKLKALAEPHDKTAKELRDWIGPDFDPAHFDLAAVNKELRRVFRPASEKRRKPGH